MESWAVIKIAPKYEASTLGKIRSIRTGAILKSCSTPGGWLRVSLPDASGKVHTKGVHTFVASAFLPTDETRPTINHINFDRADNAVANLERMSIAEQNRHKQKEKARDVKKSSRAVWKKQLSDASRIAWYPSLTHAAASINGKVDTKSKICAAARGARNKAYGFLWEYDSSNDVLEGEVWVELKPELIEGIDGYWISTMGRIRNHKGRVQQPYTGSNGYLVVSAYPKQYRVHRLVAQTFLTNPNDHPVVNHRDGDTKNACVSNLEWCTYAQNSQHAHDTRLNDSGIGVMQFTSAGDPVATYPSMALAHRKTAIDASDISRACKARERGERKHAGGFLWMFAEGPL